MERPFPAYEGNEPFIFVCYAHDDAAVVYPELTRLRNAGSRIWYDEGIRPSSEWPAEVAQAIKECSKFVFFVTPQSAASEHCRRELHFAQSNGRPVVPIYLTPTELPDQLELQIGLTQAIYRFEVDPENYERKTRQALTARSNGSAKRIKRLLGPVAAAGIAIAFAGAIGGWWLGQRAPTTYSATSIAVLPFEDLSPTADQGWLARGMAEALVVYLSRVERLRVTQTSNDDAIETLQVGSILRGSVQRVENELVVTSRLISTKDGTERWSARYEVVFDEVLDLQLDMVREIVASIEAELGIELHTIYGEGRYGTRDVRAYEMWRRALELKMIDRFPDEEELKEALEYNLEAVSIDPDFAMGYVGLGTTHQWLYVHTRDPRDKVDAREALERAVVLDPGNTFARGTLAQIYGEDQRWGDVLAQIEHVDPWISLAQVPSAILWYVMALVNLGEWETANATIDELEHVYSRSPDRYPGIGLELALSLAIVRADYEAAVDIAEQLGAIRGWPGRLMAYVYLAARRGQEASELYAQVAIPDHQRDLAARMYSRGGWLEMLRALEPTRSGQEPGDLCDAELHAWLNETDRMYACLERSLAVSKCRINTPRERLQECMFGFEPVVSTPVWTLPPFIDYLDEPGFQALLDASGVIGYRTCCPLHPNSRDESRATRRSLGAGKEESN